MRKTFPRSLSRLPPIQLIRAGSNARDQDIRDSSKVSIWHFYLWWWQPSLPIRKSVGVDIGDIWVNNPSNCHMGVRNELILWNFQVFLFHESPWSLAKFIGSFLALFLWTFWDLLMAFPHYLHQCGFIFFNYLNIIFRILEEEINVWIQSIILTWKFKIQIQQEF